VTAPHAPEHRQPTSSTGHMPTNHLRRRAASFWLNALFRLTAAAPDLVRFAKPLFVRAAYTFSRKIRRNTAANARWILGDRSTMRDRRIYGLRVVASFYDFVYDIGRSIGKTRQQLVDRIESVEGEDTYRAARAEGKGAIILTAHMGSFEVGLVALSNAEEKRIHVVFKPDEIDAFEQLRRELRSQLNIAEAPIDQGLAIWMQLRTALMNDEVVAIQGDRVMPGQKGMAVPLLDGHVLLPTGPFKLALASGSPMIPIFSIRSPNGGVHIFIEPPIRVSNNPTGIDTAVAAFAAVLARFVELYPQQWLVLDDAFCENAKQSKGGFE
jgi:phosphatidylinositol dimannoside acyltransferase